MQSDAVACSFLRNSAKVRHGDVSNPALRINSIQALEFKSPKLTISYRISYWRFGLQAVHDYQHALEKEQDKAGVICGFPNSAVGFRFIAAKDSCVEVYSDLIRMSPYSP